LAAVVPSLFPIPRTDLALGQRLKVEAVVSPSSRSYPLLHPVFGASVLQSFHFEQRFTANLCLWTQRSDTLGDVADHSYGVLRSFDWDMLGVWSIDAAGNITAITPMSLDVTRQRTKDPLVTPKDAFCEVCAPIAVDLKQLDGRT
jgi:hypothetical protein